MEGMIKRKIAIALLIIILVSITTALANSETQDLKNIKEIKTLCNDSFPTSYIFIDKAKYILVFFDKKPYEYRFTNYEYYKIAKNILIYERRNSFIIPLIILILLVVIPLILILIFR